MEYSPESKVKTIIRGKGIRVLIILLLALLVGSQIFNPSKRVVEAAVGIVFVAMIAKFPLTWSLSVFLAVYPIPFGLKVGSSNIVFIPLMVIIWLIRVTLGTAKRPRGSILDAILIMMTISFIISLYNNPGGPMLSKALVYIWRYLTAVGFFYLIVNFVRDEKSLKFILNAGAVSCFLVIVFCILEMIFPAKVLVPGWLFTGHKRRLVMQNVRITGPFKDFELLAEFLAINIPIFILLLSRAKRLLYRFAYFGLLFLSLGLLLATSTRGAFISLFVGLSYFLFVVRKDLNIVRAAIIIIFAALLTFTEEIFVSKYTISGGLFQRLFKTKFVGFMPDTRKESWTRAYSRAKRHILIGHSPAWAMDRKLGRFTWPHNGYLYILNITGLLGLLSFLLLIFTLFRSSVKLKAKSIYDESFPRTLMLVLHVILVIFILDELKIEYLRNEKYLYFIWYIFGLVAATHNIIMDGKKRSEKSAEEIAINEMTPQAT